MHRKIISKEVNRTNSEHTSIHKQTGKRNKHIRAQHRTAHDVKINGVKRDNQEEKMKRQKELLRRATQFNSSSFALDWSECHHGAEREREGANKKRTSLMLKFVFDSNSLCFLFHFSMKTNSNWWRKWRKKHRTPNRNGERKMKSERESWEKKSTYDKRYERYSV